MKDFQVRFEQQKQQYDTMLYGLSQPGQSSHHFTLVQSPTKVSSLELELLQSSKQQDLEDALAMAKKQLRDLSS